MLSLCFDTSDENQFVYDNGFPSIDTNVPSLSISLTPIKICSPGIRLAMNVFSASDLGKASNAPSLSHLAFAEA